MTIVAPPAAKLFSVRKYPILVVACAHARPEQRCYVARLHFAPLGLPHSTDRDGKPARCVARLHFSPLRASAGSHRPASTSRITQPMVMKNLFPAIALVLSLAS